MFTCKKCNEPLNLDRVIDKGSVIKVIGKCVNGHESSRKVTRDQAQSMAEDVFGPVLKCLKCGRTLLFAHKDFRKTKGMYTFVCPEHGPIRKEVAASANQVVDQLIREGDISASINAGFTCPKCDKGLSIHDIRDERGVLVVRSVCPDGHKWNRFFTENIPPELMNGLLDRVLWCNTCGVPGRLVDLDKKGKEARIKTHCAVHGETKKMIPVGLVDEFKEAIGIEDEAPKVHSILDCHSCGKPLAIRTIMSSKRGYKLTCRCSNSHESVMKLPLTWDPETSEAIAAAIVRCRICGLFSPITDRDIGKRKAEIEITCPVHREQKKAMSVEVYKQIEDDIPEIDLTGSVDKSMRCPKCHTPYIIKTSKVTDEGVQFKVRCRNGHGASRLYALNLERDDMVQVYDHLFECPRCHAKQEFVGFSQEKDDISVNLNCATHGSSELKIPPGHESVVRSAYLRSVNLSWLEKLVNQKFQTKVVAEFTLDESSNIMENLQMVMHVIGEKDLQFVAEKTLDEGENEVWYFGMTDNNDEFVVIGSVSQAKKMVGIRIAAEDESMVSHLMAEMKKSLSEILLKRMPVTESKPIKIACPHCMAPMSRRALPGETITCDACGTPIHWT
jgi:predicted Zn finger-like uncharacterized protein